MLKNTDRDHGSAAGPPVVAGTRVKDGVQDRRCPRAVAFMWGPEVSPAPSLPFGRWKAAVRSAA